jgi:hypothetical protein
VCTGAPSSDDPCHTISIISGNYAWSEIKRGRAGPVCTHPVGAFYRCIDVYDERDDISVVSPVIPRCATKKRRRR